MEKYKEELIDLMLYKGAFFIDDTNLFELGSNRKSPYFIKTDKFGDGDSISKLGYFYASRIDDRFKENKYDIIFGPAYKGIPLSVATAISLRSFGINKRYAFDRKERKDYGDANKKDVQKGRVAGSEIEDGDKVLILDDVMTTGRTKYNTINLLNSVADNLKYVGLIVLVDRQEIGTDGKSARKSFEDETGIPVESIVTISEIKDYLSSKGKIPGGELKRIDDYLRKYGRGV